MHKIINYVYHLQFQDEVTTNDAHTFGTSTTLSDLVTQGTTETIAGAKSFTAVTSSENVQVTSTINRVPIDRLYSEAVKLDSASEVTVSGSWQFSNDVNVGGTLSVTGDIDGKFMFIYVCFLSVTNDIENLIYMTLVVSIV